MSSTLRHVRHNAVAYLALFVALGGTSYAAANLPNGSVGSSQLRNHSIAPVKFNGKYINGTVRAWAVVRSDGTVEASTGTPTVVVHTTGSYAITWKHVARPSQRGCFAVAGLSSLGEVPGSAEAALVVQPKGSWGVGVTTFDPQGEPIAHDFYTAVIC